MTNPSNGAALLIMDIQEATVSRIGEAGAPILQSFGLAIAAARKAGMKIIYVVVGFRKGFPEISPNNKSFDALRQGAYPGLEEPIKIADQIAPQPGDIVVTKRRVSAFAGSDLEVILRGGQIHHLVLGGFATSGVVLSTVREAADKDYRLTVLSDCCADADAEVHQVLLGKVFPRQAEVKTAAEWAAALTFEK